MGGWRTKLDRGLGGHSHLWFDFVSVLTRTLMQSKVLQNIPKIVFVFVCVSENLAEKNHTEKKDLDRLLFPYFANLLFYSVTSK